MAGRCISVTHEALGTTRVMKTCGMMGEVVGKASSICVARECLPRDVYEQYLPDLKELLQLPGQARRTTVSSPIVLPEKVMTARPEGPPTGLDPVTLTGQVMDDLDADKQGTWTEGTGLKGYVGNGYVYASHNSQSLITFKQVVKTAGRYEVLVAYQPHENRGKTVHINLRVNDSESEHIVNMTQKPTVEGGFTSLGTKELSQGDICTVQLSTDNANGFVHADAVWLRPVTD